MLVAALGAGACHREAPHEHRDAPHTQTIQVVPRTPLIATFSCMAQCHSRLAPNPAQRELRTFHVDKRLNHGQTLTWCTFCHQDDQLDSLHLINGTLVPFDEAYRVCAQCHEERYRDWTRGVHGSTTGSWRDVGVRRSCPTCHNPHDPHRGQFEALPPPARERALGPHEGGHGAIEGSPERAHGAPESTHE